jgi:hypothetical protein
MACEVRHRAYCLASKLTHTCVRPLRTSIQTARIYYLFWYSEGIHQYGGGYTEYVERTGREVPARPQDP